MYEPPEDTKLSFRTRSTVSTGHPLEPDNAISISSGWDKPSRSEIISQRLSSRLSRNPFLLCESCDSSRWTHSSSFRSAFPTTPLIASSRLRSASINATQPQASTRTPTNLSPRYRTVADESPA